MLAEQLHYFGADSYGDKSKNDSNKPNKRIRHFKSKHPFYIDDSGNYHPCKIWLATYFYQCQSSFVNIWYVQNTR